MNSLRKYTLAEVAQHNREGDAWLVIDNGVYDVSKFAALHPAGKKILLKQAGTDASEVYAQFHTKNLLLYKYAQLKIGELVPNEQRATEQGQLKLTNGGFELVPYADPSYLQGWHSPYFNDSHANLRKAVRAFVLKEIAPYFEEWEVLGIIPAPVIKKCGEQGLFAMVIGRPWPKEYVPKIKLFGVALDNPDSFHEAILSDEFNRIGTGGIKSALTTGIAVGLPPILEKGSKYLRERVAKPCLNGDKICVLAITEPWAGSDVAAIRTTAVKSPCGKFYIVNGMKKWITNGMYADFFTTAVKTDEGAGMGGVSLLLIESGMAGFSKRKIKCQGISASGTSFLMFENVHVPVENLIGQENEGFRYIMVNFNHERLMIVFGSLRLLRNLIGESLRHAHRRKTFGKALIEHAVIRAKLANMIRETEACQALVDQLIYNFDTLPRRQNLMQLSPVIALCKVQLTRTFELCAREAAQIFGGLAYTQTGLGANVERMYREVKGLAVPGGSEEIMLDLGARMSSRLMPKI